MICHRCLTPNEVSELRNGKKVKGLPVKQSREIKRCKNCNCIVFY